VAAPVRQPLPAHTEPHRTLDDRIAIRFPGLAARQARLLSRLPPSSRLRQALIARAVHHALSAFNRRDLAGVLALCTPDYEYRPGHEWVEAGLVEPVYRGATGYRQYVASVDQVWGGENYLTPREVIDAGDRLLLLADGDMRGQASGVPLRQEFALLCTLRHGLNATAQEYYSHAEARRLIGVD
jgi:ketosteroid isomerase-like protein